jgi:quinohemoprotein ethanol dehydrogenase
VDKNILENLGIFVFKGPFYSLGMPDFTDKLSQDDVSAIKAYIQGTADAIRESGGKEVKDETVH